MVNVLNVVVILAPFLAPELTLTPTTEPLNVLVNSPTIPVYSMNSVTPEMIPTNFIAEGSLKL